MAFYATYDATGTEPFDVVGFGVCQSGMETVQGEPGTNETSIAITEARYRTLDTTNLPTDEQAGQVRWTYTPSTQAFTSLTLAALSARREAVARRRMGALIATARRRLTSDSLLTDAARQAWVDYVRAVEDLPNDPNWPDWSAMTIPAQPAVTNDATSWFKRLRDFRDDPGARVNAVGTKVSADRLAGGTALDGTITTGGDALSTIRSRAEDPIARANLKATLFKGSKIEGGTLSQAAFPNGEIGGFKLQDAAVNRPKLADSAVNDSKVADVSAAKLLGGTSIPDTVLAKGMRSVGDISDWADDPIARANSKSTFLSLGKLAARPGGNLLPNSHFEHLFGWTSNPDGNVGFQSGMEIRSAGESWAGYNYPTLHIYQDGTATSGHFDVISRGSLGIWDAPVTPGNYYEASIQLSVHRCDFALNLRWYDASGTWFDTNGTAVQTGPLSESDDPDAWPRYRIVGQAPTGARSVALSIRKFGTSRDTTSVIFGHKPQVAQTWDGATETVPFSHGQPPLDLVGARLMSRGSNTNGDFARWDNGIQMCWITGLNMGSGTASGSGLFGAPYFTNPIVSVPYPADFTETPGVSAHAVNSGPVGHRSFNLEWASLLITEISYLRAVKNSNDGDTSDVIANITLVGRYK